MAYKKILVDNPTCSRRFHITYNDEEANLAEVKIRCLHCQTVVYNEKNHPPAKMTRDEVIVNMASLSAHRVQNCDFEDNFSPAPVNKE